MDLTGLKNDLLAAMEKQNEIAKNNQDIARNLAQQQINVGANASGTLFSSQPIFKGMQYAQKYYLPQRVQLMQNQAQNQIKLSDSVQQAIDQINALNEASKALGG